MIGEDYDKLREFVRNGGTLLIGLPQFSTHVKRDFLKTMNDLALWQDGDLSEFWKRRVKLYLYIQRVSICRKTLKYTLLRQGSDFIYLPTR